MTVSAVAVDTGKITPLTSQKWALVNRVAWLSDGSALVINARALQTPRNQLWQITYPVGEVKRLTNDLNSYSAVSLGVTADNKTIATTHTEVTADVWLAPLATPNRAHSNPVTARSQQQNGRFGIAWTPDGRIVYASIASGS